MFRIALAAAALSVAALTPTSAQTRAAKKPAAAPMKTRFVFGAHSVFASGITVLGPDISGAFQTSLGTGAGVEAGYRVTPRVTVFAGMDYARQPSESDYIFGSMGLTHLEVGGRMTFPVKKKRWEPYATAVLGRRSVYGANGYYEDEDEDFSLKVSGMTVGLGGGILYPVTPALAIDAGLTMNFGKMNKARYTGGINETMPLDVHGSSNMRLKLGVQWSPR